MPYTQEITKKPKGQKLIIQKNVPLKDKNWFQTGGNARLFSEPKSTKQFVQLLQYAQEQGENIFVLGGGANVLISDEGFDGLIIRPKLENIWHEELKKGQILLHAQAGVQMPKLITYCLENNILGLEEFSGIPGTIGGAVYNNMHYFQFSLSDFFDGGTVINRDTGTIERKSKEWFSMGYDDSKLHDKKQYLISARFVLKKATDLEIAYARGRNKEMIRHRHARYPTARTCGCFFRNFSPKEVTLTMPGTDRKMIYVAYYLDKLGVKGALNIGQAVVSHQHANMLVNKGNATSADLIKLARTMQEKVHEAFGILPQPECELVGFKKYPLVKL